MIYTITNYRVLQFAGVNNTPAVQKFDFKLLKHRNMIIKRIKFLWFVLDESEGLPYRKSAANFDGTILQHDVIKGTSKSFIPKDSAANIYQNGNCTANLLVNSKPTYLSGEMNNLFLEENNIDISINEPIQSLSMQINNAKMLLLNG